MMTCVETETIRSLSNAPQLRILVGDDQADVREALRLLFKGEGYQSVLVESPQAILQAVRSQPFDVILMDMNYASDTTSGNEGLDLLESLEQQNNDAPVIVMTAWGSVDLAVDAMRRGASDFVQKPWDNARLLSAVRKHAGTTRERANTERRVKTELEIARNVQQKFFPDASRHLSGIDYAGRCVAASEVSGDYYDFLDTGCENLGFVLADVSGKGVAAALLMANLQACFRSQDKSALRRPAEVLASVNQLFYQSTPPEHFATLFFAHYDDGTRSFRYANCGHPPPLLVRADGSVDRLTSTATVLGVFSNWSCEEREIRFEPQDTLVLFSDGVTESGIQNGTEFGEDGVLSVIRSSSGVDAATLVDRIVSKVAAEARDDVTVVALRAR